ncbi:hypothetical protein M9H77_00963 [Catharanthus roseus]|uniref:Uncharacterized protein n=1 Tax=Catharanthus roseus TaxID=4058 RepID=A0ACC0C4L8_CATRO|nr:hypothetical protein M9H77_00963 [Catharanthus roseus]
MAKCKGNQLPLLTSFRNLLEKYGKHQALVEQIHGQSTTLGLLCYQHLACKLLNTYSKLNKPFEGQKVFNEISKPDIVSWTSLFNLYLNAQKPTKVLSLFCQFLITRSFRPDPHCIVAALCACSRSGNFNAGKAVHAMAYKYLPGPETIVNNALIDMYCRAERIHLAKLVFDGMQSRDVSTWTSLLNGFVVCGDIESARCVFNDMPKKNVVSWTAMIVGYVRFKNPIEALELFREMRAAGRDSPTSITIVAALSGCADTGALDFGMSIHACVNKIAGLGMDTAVNNGLIDMYAKSGNLDSAVNCFTRMANKDLFSWTSMISGLAFHGRGKHVLELFNEMEASRIRPNEITFLSLLSACCHSGLVDEGKILFERMLISHNISLSVEHYGSMIDLLGRAGLLVEAEQLIGSMPMKPDAVIWRSLLRACLEHGNLELAERAGNNLLELEPEDDGAYVLLWNLYKSKNMWEDALRIGKMMRDQRIKKKPGCSWVEVNGIVHEFFAEVFMAHTHDDILPIVIKSILKQSKWDDLDDCFG